MKKVYGNKIYFAKLNERAVIPSKKDEDAGYDIYACFDEDFIKLEKFETKLIPTGIAWACNKKYYMEFKERSSTGVKGIKVNAGVIDSGYRGEFKVAILNATNKVLVFTKLSNEELIKKYPEFKDEKKVLIYNTNKAIVQGIVHRVHKFKVQELSYEELSKISSLRQTGGFGSSKK